MLTPYTEKQKALIVNNIIKACNDINKLNSTGYKFINLASGFIAHYNLHGFIDYYQNNSLKHDIINNARMNQWNNFLPSDKNYHYYMSKKSVYNSILERLNNG